MKKNLYFLLICLLGVVVIVACPFFMKTVEGDSYLALYITSKVLFGLLFIGSFVYCFAKKTANGVTASLVGVTALFQLIPLAIRGIFLAGNRPVLWSILLLCFSLMVYLAFFGGLVTMGKKMVEADEKYVGHEIEVKK